jgi:hypothetical protein
LFTAETQKGGSIEPNEIIERYIVANGQRYKAYNVMQRKIKAAQELKASEDSLNELFLRRNERKNFNSIMNNEFRPMGLTKDVKQGFQRIEEDIRQNFDDATIPAGLPEYVEDILNSLQETMQNIPLGDDFGKYIRLEDWLIKDNKQGNIPGASGERQVTQVPPLPEQPMPNPQIIYTANASDVSVKSRLDTG